MTRPPVLGWPTAATVCVLLLGACSNAKTDAKAEADAHRPRSVRYVTVERRAIASSLSVSGPLTAREEAAVAPQLSGYQVARVLVDQGDWVRAGQPLAMLDDTLLRASIAQQTAAVAEARVSAERAEQEAARVNGLESAGVMSAEALAERRLSARSAEAQLKQAEAQLQDQRVRQSLMVIRAPVAGRILERAVRPGDVASPSTLMFRIARAGEVEINADVPEQNLASVRVGQSARVTTADGGQVVGRVRLISAEIDSQSRLGHARILLPVREDLRAGGFARAVLDSGGEAVSAVREGAVSYGVDGAALTLIDARNVVSTALVSLGRRGGGYVEVTKGPPVGTRALLGAQGFVLDGDRVDATPAAPLKDR